MNELGRQKKMYENIFHSILSPIVVATEQLEITFINKATTTVFGYEQEELIGQNVKILMPLKTAEEHDNYVNRYKDTGIPHVIGTTGRNVQGKTKDGVIIDLILSMSDIIENGERKFVATFQDITKTLQQEKELIHQKEIYKSIFHSILSPIVVADEQLHITFVNKATTTIFGYEKEELIGQNVKILMPKKIADKHDGYINRYKRTGIQHVIGTGGRNVQGQTKDEKIIDLILSMNDIVDDGKRCFVAIFQDITKALKQEREMKLMESISKTKSQFLANMSHEIRTPMNGIFGMLTLLKDTEMSVKQKDYLDICHRSAEGLLSILNDILLFSKADADSIELESIPFNVNNLIEDVVHIMSGNVTLDKNLDIVSYIKPDVPLYLIGDPSRLRQILTNLVSNAIKFTQIGEVALEISVKQKEPLILRFDICDTGIGLSEEQCKQLFKPFSQADGSTTRKYGGTGLGLAICKKLVELYNGKIWVTSRIGRGSTFSFTAQFMVDTTVDPKVEPYGLKNSDTDVLKDLKILIIDDNATNCLSLECLLKPLCREVESTRSGIDGINRIKIANFKEDPFDILLLDYHMPQMDGIQVAKSLQRMQINNIKIFALSSSLDHDVLLREPNIYGCTTKPIRKTQLLYSMCRSVSEDINIIITDKNECVIGNDKKEISNENKKKILVVEDNDVNREVVSSALERFNYHVEKACNGVEALDVVKRVSDLYVILMDIHMPLMDGIEATKYIRKSGYDIPIIAITADISPLTKQKCMDIGINYYLNKPIKIKELMKIIHNIVVSCKKTTNILVVDDNETNQMIIKNFLMKINKNYKINIVSDGREAISELEGDKYDIVFMDVIMPSFNGMDVTKIIRQINLKRPIIIGVTGLVSPEDHKKCIDSGMNDVLTKPITIEKLKNIINKHMILSVSINQDNDLNKELKKNKNKTIMSDIDVVLLAEVVNNNKQLAEILLSKLDSQIKESLATFRNGNNFTKLKETAHTIKGTSFQLGINTIGNLMQKAEELFSSENVDKKQLKNIIQSYQILSGQFSANMNAIISLLD